MAEEHHQEGEVRYYDYSIDGKPVEPDKVPGDCPACRGTGKVLLLVSARPCEACGGTGKSERHAAGPPSVGPLKARAGTWVTTYTYDAADVLVRQVERFIPEPGAGSPE
jgi:RecJ-like exonuclease